jgi:hypothetical protein
MYHTGWHFLHTTMITSTFALTWCLSNRPNWWTTFFDNGYLWGREKEGNTNRWVISSCGLEFIHSFIQQCLYSPFIGPWPLLQFRDLVTQTAGPLGRMISPSQGLYLYTGQHKHRINTQTSMPRVGFEPTIPASERAKTVVAWSGGCEMWLGHYYFQLFPKLATVVTSYIWHCIVL